MIPKIYGVGRLGSDIELRYSKDNKPIATGSLAFSEGDETLWLNFAAFGKTADILHQYCKKGDRIEVAGVLKEDVWISKDGQKRRMIKLIINKISFIENKNSKKSNSKKPKWGEKKRPSPQDSDDIEEIPF